MNIRQSRYLPFVRNKSTSVAVNFAVDGSSKICTFISFNQFLDAIMYDVLIISNILSLFKNYFHR